MCLDILTEERKKERKKEWTNESGKIEKENKIVKELKDKIQRNKEKKKERKREQIWKVKKNKK